MKTGSLTIRVKSTAPDLARAFGDLARRQLPYATAVALTRTASDARDAFQARVGAIFQARSKAFQKGASTRQGVSTYVRAEKRDWPHTHALIGIKPWAGFLVLHEKGGLKRPQRGARHLAIPIIGPIKRTSTGKIPAPKKPRRVRSEGGYVAGATIRKRQGRGRNRKSVALYILKAKARIRPILKLEGTVRRTAERRYPGHFRREFEVAIESARARAAAKAGR